MSNHAQKAIATADKVVTLAEDGLRGLERTIASWPEEFQAIVWIAVADIAQRRAIATRQVPNGDQR